MTRGEGDPISQRIKSGIARIHRVASASRDNVEPSMGPYRPIRTGEAVKETDVTNASGRPMVPERIYGGRRRRGPLPAGVPTDRRKS